MRPALSNRSAMHCAVDSSRGNVTFPPDWFRYPIGTSELLDRIAGTRWYSVWTAGDGACSLHALWGFPRATLGRCELWREYVREHVLAKVPLSWGEVESLGDGDLSAAFKDVVMSKFADLVDSTVNDFEKQEFQRLLPSQVQEDATQYLRRVRTWKETDEQVTEDFDAFARDFFTTTNEPTLVRALAHACEYISTVDVDVLHVDVGHPRAAEWGGTP